MSDPTKNLILVQHGQTVHERYHEDPPLAPTEKARMTRAAAKVLEIVSAGEGLETIDLTRSPERRTMESGEVLARRLRASRFAVHDNEATTFWKESSPAALHSREAHDNGLKRLMAILNLQKLLTDPYKDRQPDTVAFVVVTHEGLIRSFAQEYDVEPDLRPGGITTAHLNLDAIYSSYPSA